jgi:sugar-specific transcriptional regulator TrmB
MALIDIKKALKSYGLDEREIKVYLSVLALGDATVTEIAEFTKLKRTSVYLICDRLVSLGIMGDFRAKYGTHYAVSSAKTLVSRLENIKTEIEGVMPELMAIEKRELYSPNVKFFRGKQGYLTVLDDSLDGYSYEILYFGSAKELNDVVTENYVTEKYIPGRIKRRLKFRQIVLPDEFSKQLARTDEKELRRTKLLPPDILFDSNMIIYRNKIAYFSSKREMTAVLIESKDIAEMERKKFEMMWTNMLGN